MSEALTPTYTHIGGFGTSEARRPLAFGAAVDKYGRKLRLQGVRVRGAGTGDPHLKIKIAGESIKVAVDPNDEDLALVLNALSFY